MPSTLFLRASLALWERRARTRKALHTRAQTALDQARDAGDHPRQQLVDRRDQRTKQLLEARAMVTRRRRELAQTGKPKVITARPIGLAFQNVFGARGHVSRATGHYTAGPRASTAARGVQIARQVHAQHKAQGWGGCSYDAIICDDGTPHPAQLPRAARARTSPARTPATRRSTAPAPPATGRPPPSRPRCGGT